MANARQHKLGAVLVGVGNDQFGWRDPELPGDAQQRGLFKTEYFADTLRGHLDLPVPENRWAAAQSTQAAE